jgi:hypothetical protein
LGDYWSRNFAVRLREKEVNALVKEFTNPLSLQNLDPDWKQVKLSANVVLMG